MSTVTTVMAEKSGNAHFLISNSVLKRTEAYI